MRTQAEWKVSAQMSSAPAMPNASRRSRSSFAALFVKGHGEHLPRRRRLHRAELPHPAALVCGRLSGIILKESEIVLRRTGGDLAAVAPAAIGQKICDAVDEHGRLAAAGSREQQQRPLRRQDAAPLLRIQLCKIPRNARAAARRSGKKKSLMRSTCFLKILLDSTASPLPGQPFFPEFCKEIKNLFYFLLTSTFVRFIMRLEQEF